MEAVLKKKNGAGGIKLPDFRLCYKVTVIKIVWSWYENKKTYRSTEQDRKPAINPHIYDQLISDNEASNMKLRKDSLFSKWCWENWTAACKIMKI